MMLRKTGGRYIPILILAILMCGAYSSAWAGPNASAGCALDLDISTKTYDSGVTTTDIEKITSAAVNDEVLFVVVAQNVTNLDTYNVEITFDPSRLEFMNAFEDNSIAGVPTNFLKSNGGSTIGFQATSPTPGQIIISNTLTGEDTDQAPEGSGIIALLQFKVLDGDANNQLSIASANFLDSTGAEDSITNLSAAVYNFDVTAPTITDVSPTSGASGVSVTITGTNFSTTGTTTVDFGTTAATGVTVDSATQITCTAPAGTGLVDVKVTTDGKSVTKTGAFTYASATDPTITTVNPTSGASGDTVTITGTNFSTTGTTTVDFGTTAATSVTVVSATQITCTAPAGTGLVAVKVTTDGKSVTKADAFTYASATDTGPIITSILANGTSPDLSIIQGGADVDLEIVVSDATTGGSNVTGAEYFILDTDSDPDTTTRGTAMTGSSGVETTFTAKVLNSALSPSPSSDPIYKYIIVRGMDANGSWGSTKTINVVITEFDKNGPVAKDIKANGSEGTISLVAGAAFDLTALISDATKGSSNIKAAEYYEGATDPGVGSATAMAAASGETFNSSYQTNVIASGIDTTGWTDGDHTITVRGQDTADKWGSIETITVSIIATDNLKPITSAVKANDQDALTIIQGTANITLTAIVSDATTGGSNIKAAEYYEGATDPGEGSGTAMDAKTGETFNSSPTVNVTTTIDTSGWTAGTSHTIYVRGQDAAASENWSTPVSIIITVVATDSVGPATTDVKANGLTPLSITEGTANITLTAIVSDATTGGSNIKAAEYYEGATDPGEGSGTAMDAKTGETFNSSPTVNVTKTIDTSGWTAGTSHTIYVRGQDAAASENWGSPVSVTITVTAALSCDKLGDVNKDGTISIVDALLTAKIDAGVADAAILCTDQADVNANGSIDINDALMISEAAAGCRDKTTFDVIPGQTCN